MKKLFNNIQLLGFTILLFACSSPSYIYNKESYHRQKEIKEMRSDHVIDDIFNGTTSVISAALFSEYLHWEPTEQQFKKLNIVNPTFDTIYVNMLTDVYWDTTNYCDFMDIRIPPKENCKLLVPVDAVYNLYFSNTSQNDDDEMLEINTNKIKELRLNPGKPKLSSSNKFPN